MAGLVWFDLVTQSAGPPHWDIALTGCGAWTTWPGLLPDSGRARSRARDHWHRQSNH